MLYGLGCWFEGVLAKPGELLRRRKVFHRAAQTDSPCAAGGWAVPPGAAIA